MITVSHQSHSANAAVPTVSSSPTLTVVDDSDPLVGESPDVPAALPPCCRRCNRCPIHEATRRAASPGRGARGDDGRHTGRSAIVRRRRRSGHRRDAGGLARLGIRAAVPSESTIRRCLRRLARTSWIGWSARGCGCAPARSASAGHRVRRQDTTRRPRRSGNPDASAGRVVPAHRHRHRPIAVGAQTTKIPMLTKLLETLDVRGGDNGGALHCQRGTADYIVDRGGHYMFTVKATAQATQNIEEPSLEQHPGPRQPASSTATAALAERVLKATEIEQRHRFPHAVQVLQLTRTVTDGRPATPHRSATPSPRSRPPTPTPATSPTGYAGHWHLGKKLHWVRDVTFAEDHSQIRTSGGPQVIATLRDTVIGVLRLTRHDNVAAALRHHARDHHRPVELLLSCWDATLPRPSAHPDWLGAGAHPGSSSEAPYGHACASRS